MFDCYIRVQIASHNLICIWRTASTIILRNFFFHVAEALNRQNAFEIACLKSINFLIIFIALDGRYFVTA